ncbi:MAG TPA: DUF2231 domain-containing protein [Gemmatimonadaceae bacterium]|nr:DUF2231 domain-containing protein [Gemmatimonadaceae bacterium]
MDATWMHLLVNHFPVVLSIVGLASLIVGAATAREFFWRAGLTLMLLAGIAAVPAFLTGDAAHKIIERRLFVVRGTIGAHDDAAGVALWALLTCAAANAWALWRARASNAAQLAGWLRAVVLVLALAAVGSVSYAAYLGGRIVHDSPVLQGERMGGGPGPGATQPE